MTDRPVRRYLSASRTRKRRRRGTSTQLVDLRAWRDRRPNITAQKD